MSGPRGGVQEGDLGHREGDVAHEEKQVEYLREVLGRYGPGRPGGGLRILDLGCGTGGLAVRLAEKGHLVTGVDRSSAAIARARCAAVSAGVRVDFSQLDFLELDTTLPIAEIDAAICLPFVGWGDDADQLRLLQSIRGKMAAGGILVLDHGNPLCIARHFGRTYDLGAGRVRAGLTMSAQDERSSTAGRDVRLYTIPELANLVRAAGFEIVGVHADFAAGQQPTTDSRNVQIVATPLPAPPADLALSFHGADAAAELAQLNLKWSPDEVEWLEPALEAVWSPMLAGGTGEIARLSRDYALIDPWGGERAAPVISAFFGVELSPESIVFGAGATGLLRQIAPLARAGRLLTNPYVHRDFALWAVAEAASLAWIDESEEDEVRDAIAATAPTLIYLDRPSALGTIIPRGNLVGICRQALQHRGLVVIDEAYHAYFAGSDSAVSLIPSVDNLVVIRSLSKAYCCGGLRVGFAVGGTAAARALRRLVAPLQVSELAFQMGLRLLEAGDMFAKLRRRIREAKTAMTGLLAGADLKVVAGHEDLPWVLVEDASGRVHAEFMNRGIAGKRLLPFSPGAAPGTGWLRLSVPLSAERMARFQRSMVQAGGCLPGNP